MQQKILILGSSGMLGHDLAAAFADQKPVLWDANDLDITNERQVNLKLKELKPTLAINAAAYTDVDGAETNKDLAMKVNGEAVGHLASACGQIGAILVHFSSEYVYSGLKQDGYTEADIPDPINTYGRSKALGEDQLKKKCEMYYLIRSSWLYGKSPQVGKPRGLNFVETMLKLAGDGKQIKVVNDQFGKPTYTKDLALAAKKLVDSQSPCGTYHLVNETACSWYDFAKMIFELKNLEVDLRAISSDEYPVKTPRPQYAILHNTKTEQLRNWEEALAEYLKS